MQRARTWAERLPRLAPAGRGARGLAVHDVGRDRQQGERVLRVPVRGGRGQLPREVLRDEARQVVHAAVVVAKARELPLALEVHREARVVADGRHAGVLDGGQRVRHDAEPGHPERHEAVHVGVVQRQLDRLVVVPVVAVVDAVHGAHVLLREPGLRLQEPLHDLLVQQRLRQRRQLRQERDQQPPRHLVPAAVEDAQQELRHVAPRSEELHVGPELHGGHAARDAVVRPEAGPHEVVVLVLDRGGVDGDLGGEALGCGRGEERVEDGGGGGGVRQGCTTGGGGDLRGFFGDGQN